MLQAIREKTTGWLAYAIIFLISIPFVLVGVNSYFGGGEAVPYATVGEVEIDSSRFNQAYSNYRQRLSDMFGGEIPELFGSDQLIKQQVLDQLIRDEAFMQHVLSQGYYIDDVQLGQMLRQMEEFQIDGQFDANQYQAQIRSLGYSPSGFEALYRQDRIVSQYRSSLTSSGFMLPYETQYQAQLDAQKRQISYLTLMDEGTPEVEDEELRSEYESNPDRYAEREQVQIDYLLLDPANLAQSIEVSEQDLLDRYNDSLASYRQEAVREASHILIKVDQDASSDVEQGALEKLQGLQQRIKNGDSFADIAREYSEDTFSAVQGGSLGQIDAGVMVKPFEDAVFAMNAVGQLSEPVRSSFGWHLIQLDAYTAGSTQPFEQVQDQLLAEMRADKAEARVYEWSEQLANLSYENPDSLLPAAETLGLNIQSSDWFTRTSGEGLGSNAQVRNAAFSEAVLQEGLNSDVIELEDRQLIVLRLKQHQPEFVPELSEVREQVLSVVQNRKKAEQFESRANSALAQLKNGDITLSQLAEQQQLILQQPEPLERTNSDVPAVLTRAVFTLAKPGSDGRPVYSGVSISESEYALVALEAVMSGDSVLVDNETLQQQAAERGQQELVLSQSLLMEMADVTRGNLEELTEE